MIAAALSHQPPRAGVRFPQESFARNLSQFDLPPGLEIRDGGDSG